MTILMYDLAAADDRVRFSPYCWRVRMALLHKAMPFDTRPWRFSDTADIEFSGQARVPVLVDGAQVVHDSWEIACYLDAAYPDNPTLPIGESGRSATRFIKHWTERVLHPAVSRVIMIDLFAALHPADQPYFRASRERRFGEALENYANPGPAGIGALCDVLAPLRDTLTRQPFLAGASPAFADYVVFGPFMWAHAGSDQPLLAGDDPVHAWRERMRDAFGAHARNSPVHRTGRIGEVSI